MVSLSLCGTLILVLSIGKCETTRRCETGPGTTGYNAPILPIATRCDSRQIPGRCTNLTIELRQGHPTVALALDVLSWPVYYEQCTCI